MSTQAEQAQQDAGEPSIEEILASIRKIISEDDPSEELTSDAEADNENNDLPLPPEPEPVPEPPAELLPEPVAEAESPVEEDILELTDMVEEEPLELTAPEEVQDASPPAPEPEIKAEQKPMTTEPEPQQSPSSDVLVSSLPETAATDAMARLARTAQQVAPKPRAATEQMHVSTRSLDEIVETLLRPMLREWLDGNLPLLVEKLVERELNRMARRAEER